MNLRSLIAAFGAAVMLACVGAGPTQAQGPHFGEHDRHMVREWYRDHRDNPAFEGRSHWNEEMERRLQPGVEIGRDVRPWARPVPRELLDHLTPLPRHLRYVFIGDHICIVDGWRLIDVYHLDHADDEGGPPPPAVAFTDQDLQILHEWYADHRDRLPIEFEARLHWNADFENRFQIGVALGPDMRRWAHPVPHELADRLHPLPPGFRYMVMGNHICIVDDAWNVRDIYHFER